MTLNISPITDTASVEQAALSSLCSFHLFLCAVLVRRPVLIGHCSSLCLCSFFKLPLTSVFWFKYKWFVQPKLHQEISLYYAFMSSSQVKRLVRVSRLCKTAPCHGLFFAGFRTFGTDCRVVHCSGFVEQYNILQQYSLDFFTVSSEGLCMSFATPFLCHTLWQVNASSTGSQPFLFKCSVADLAGRRRWL